MTNDDLQLNVADELFRARDQRVSESDSLSARAVALEEMVDQALTLAGHSSD